MMTPDMLALLLSITFPLAAGVPAGNLAQDTQAPAIPLKSIAKSPSSSAAATAVNEQRVGAQDHQDTITATSRTGK